MKGGERNANPSFDVSAQARLWSSYVGGGGVAAFGRNGGVLNGRLDCRASALGETGVRGAVESAFQQAAAAQGRALQPLSDDLPLLDSGLDTLSFAIVGALLETHLGIDPFSDLDDALFPASFGAFVELYEAAAAARPGA